MPMPSPESEPKTVENPPNFVDDAKEQAPETLDTGAETHRMTEEEAAPETEPSPVTAEMAQSGIRVKEGERPWETEVARVQGTERTSEKTAPTTESVLEETPKNESAWKRFWSTLKGKDKDQDAA